MSIPTATVSLEHDAQGGAYLTIQTPEGPLTVGPFNPNLSQTLIAVGSTAPTVQAKPAKESKKRVRRRSMRQEDEIAERHGGRRVPGSGAGRKKGDVHVPGLLRLEAKFTTKGSYTLKHADLLKIRSEAHNLELPAFEVHFVEPRSLRTLDRWTVVDTRLFDFMEYKPPYATTHD